MKFVDASIDQFLLSWESQQLHVSFQHFISVSVFVKSIVNQSVDRFSDRVSKDASNQHEREESMLTFGQERLAELRSVLAKSISFDSSFQD